MRVVKFIIALILLALGSVALLSAPSYVVDVMSENDPDLTRAMIKEQMFVVPIGLVLVILSTWSIRGFFVSKKPQRTQDLDV